MTRCVLVSRAFTQTDPMPYGAGSSFESSYVYGQNNPGLYTDPSGLRAGMFDGWGDKINQLGKGLRDGLANLNPMKMLRFWLKS
jgi:hypothetical protein